MTAERNPWTIPASELSEWRSDQDRIKELKDVLARLVAACTDAKVSDYHYCQCLKIAKAVLESQA